MHLCPYCLEKRDLAQEFDSDGGRVLRCPNPACADFTVPLLYAEDYPDYPLSPVSIIGLSGHGKTVFIESLLREFNRLGQSESWQKSGFYLTWLDEVQMRKASTRLRQLREGQLPKGTKTVFQQPQLIRLSHIPRIGGSQLIVYDTGGEAFLDAATLTDAAKYVRNSPTVIWLLSLKKGDPYDTPDDVNQMMTVYLQSMARMGGKTREQTLILVLTKGDELLARPDLPEGVRTALTATDYSPAGTIWGHLDRASTEIESWLCSEACGYHNLVNLVRARFKQVRYCVVSAQGAPANGGSLQYDLMPRGVMAPLLWLWRLDRDPVWVSRDGKREMYLNLADAIAGAGDGATIELEDRVYNLPTSLSLQSAVTIVGKGAGKTLLKTSAPGYGVGVASNGQVTFRGLTIHRSGSIPGDVVRHLGGSLHLDDVIISGGQSGTVDDKAISGVGVLVAKNAIQISVNDTIIRNNHASGLLVLDRASAIVQTSIFEGNGDAGVYLRTRGSADVTRSTFRSNQSGLWIEAIGTGNIADNACTGQGASGIVASGKVNSDLVIQRNQCHANSREGIQVRSEAQPKIVGNQCQSNKRNGISLTDQSEAIVEGNTCQSNLRNGIRVCDDARPTLRENTLEMNGESGILFEDRSQGSATGNICERNTGDGIRIETQAAPELRSNHVRSNESYGVAIAGENSRTEFDSKSHVLDGNRRGPILDLRGGRKSSRWFSR